MENDIVKMLFFQRQRQKKRRKIKTISGAPPLSFKAKAGALKNYRIYGNTVDGESVGDRTGNLFDMSSVYAIGYIDDSGNIAIAQGYAITTYNFIPIDQNSSYSIKICGKLNDNTNQRKIRVAFYDRDQIFISHTGLGEASDVRTFNAINNSHYIRISIDDGNTNIMLNAGSTALPYEPYGYRVPVTVEGTNICNNSWEQKLIDANTGIASSSSTVVCCDFIPVKPNVTYSCSRTIRDNYNNLRCYGANKDYLGTGADLANKANPLIQWESFGTFMITDARVSYIRFNDLSNSLDTKYMLVEGAYTAETMPSYEPYCTPVTTNIYLPEQIKKVGDEAEYIDYGEQKQHRVRKNLLLNTAASQTIDGVTFTVNSDRSVTCNGTANNVVLYEIYSFPRFSGECILSGCPMGGSQNTYRLQYTNLRNLSYKDYGTGVNIYQFDEIQYPTSKINIRIEKGYTCNNLTFYPMIRKADIEDDTYEPYITNTELDVTLPALPVLPGTNTLTVGTEAQPSDIYLKGKIKKKPKIYYKIYYYSQDGQTALSTETVEEGHDCTYSTVPTKESDTDFDYTFTGWSTTTNQSSPTSGATTNIQQDTNLYAAFSKSFKTDTISDSWKDIITACNNGTYSGKYQVGDLKTIDVGTEGPVQMQIVAIDTDLLASDNTQAAPITWISKQLLNTSAAMNSTATNYLSDWTNCDMRTYLKNTILPMLPSVVQNNIKEVTKYTNQRTGSTTFTTISSTEDIWLPSYREISNNTSYCETSGVQYNSIFTDNASRVKSKVGNSAHYWWTRSASGNSNSSCSYYFSDVGSGGIASYNGSYCTFSRGVAIGFCT